MENLEISDELSNCITRSQKRETLIFSNSDSSLSKWKVLRSPFISISYKHSLPQLMSRPARKEGERVLSRRLQRLATRLTNYLAQAVLSTTDLHWNLRIWAWLLVMETGDSYTMMELLYYGDSLFYNLRDNSWIDLTQSQFLILNSLKFTIAERKKMECKCSCRILDKICLNQPLSKIWVRHCWSLWSKTMLLLIKTDEVRLLLVTLYPIIYF